ncbi:hypothetical protein DL769_004315 [Monosporascus sp. CRB-8-3]|nr:hypothetical protein DL769_004315 [Monosporascus sp. CRB-8-3]
MEMKTICEDCGKVADELGSILATSPSHTKLNNFRQALKLHWNEERINSLADRLAEYRQQLILCILMFLRDRATEYPKDASTAAKAKPANALRVRTILSRTEEASWWIRDLDEPWTKEELLDGLVAIVSLHTRHYKFAFFIDGLDEFYGDHTKMAAWLQDLSKLDNVHLCVSSRPEQEFEDAFSKTPSLRLQDLTRPDIEHYARSRLTNHIGFLELSERDPDYAEHLIDNITDKAEGVFLWVRFVVDSLLDGLAKGDRVTDLQEILDSLPTELESLFERILERCFYSNLPKGSKRPRNGERAAQLLQLVYASLEAPSILELYFADEGDPDRATSRPVGSLDHKWEAFSTTMQRRINSRLLGLLEPQKPAYHPLWSAKVHYMHRTVRDFLETERIRNMIEAAAPSPYLPALNLCAAQLVLLKTDSPHLNGRWDNLKILTRFEHYAREVQLRTGSLPMSLIADFGKTLDTVAPDLSSKFLAFLETLLNESENARAFFDAIESNVDRVVRSHLLELVKKKEYETRSKRREVKIKKQEAQFNAEIQLTRSRFWKAPKKLKLRKADEG